MKRSDSLEGLRGIAAFMVLFNHLGVMFYPAYYWGVEETGRHCELIEYYLGQTPLAVLFAGHSGVIIFHEYPMEMESQWIFYHFLPRQYVSYYHMAGAFLLIYISLFCNPVKKILESKV